MGIKKKGLLSASAIVGLLFAGVASARGMDQWGLPINGPAVMGGGIVQEGTQFPSGSYPMLLAAAEDSGGGDFGGVLGLPTQPPEQRRPYTLEQGDLLVRMRFIDISPKGGNGPVKITPYNTSGSELKVTSATGFEGDVTYMVTSKIGMEVSLESSKHLLKDNGTVAKAIGQGSDLIGATGMLPLTVTAQYHFTLKPAIHPYVGLGLNYTLFSQEESGLSGVNLSVDNTLGFAAQFGVDIGFHEKWFLNADMKYIDMSSTMSLTNPSSGVTDKTDLKISPWVFGVGLGTYF